MKKLASIRDENVVIPAPANELAQLFDAIGFEDELSVATMTLWNGIAGVTKSKTI